jgi:hypothetical protein
VAGSACQNLGQLSRPEGRAGVDVLVDPPLPLAAGSVAVTEALGELGRAVGCGAWTPASPLRATVELGGYDRQRTMIARVRPLHPEGP